jgi:glycerophosphoryl diester phosphodiesterase
VLPLLSPTFFQFSRRVFMEQTLTACLLGVLYCAVRALDEDRPRWLLGVGLLTAVGVLTKSYAGGFAATAVVAYLALAGPRRWLWSRPFLLGCALGAVPILGYLALMTHLEPDQFVHQNLLPFRIRTAGQFSWYRFGRWFYYTMPLRSDPLVYVGGVGALGFLSWRARVDASLKPVRLLLAYVLISYAVWDSASAKRLYYLVPVFPAMAIALAVLVGRLAPAGRPRTVALAVAVGLFPILQASEYLDAKLDPEAALEELGQELDGLLPEDELVFRYNDFFAATELYLGRRAVGLTPSPEMLSDFRRILVLGEQDIVRDGRPTAVYALFAETVRAGRPFQIVAEEAALGKLMPGTPGLHPWLGVAEPDGGTLWFASTQPPPARWTSSLEPHRDGYGVALAWRVAQGDLPGITALLADAETRYGAEFAASLGEAHGFRKKAASLESTELRTVDRPTCLVDPDCDYLFSLAHRGATLRAPENTILALHLAEDLGADAVEVDVRRTADDVLVLMHDRTVDRTTNGTGAVSEMTLKQVRALRVPSGFEGVDAQRVPTFLEALRALGPSTLVNVDAKTSRVDLIQRDLAEAGMLGRAWVQTAGQAETPEVGGTWARLLLQPNAKTAEGVAELLPYHPPTIELPAALDVAEVFDACLAGGVKPAQNALGNVDRAAQQDVENGGDGSAPYRVLVDRGVRIIQTDRPDILVPVLDALNAQRGWRRPASADRHRPVPGSR